MSDSPTPDDRLTKDYEIVWNSDGAIQRERYNGIEADIMGLARKKMLEIGGTIPVNVFERIHVATIRLDCITEMKR